MIKLKNVSKFYYSKGVIASGFTKISLDFEIGEFIAITGESGSGKSTLINVISGLESYEEGEMYINGKETSHYLEKDWEIYRRKNIGNIYQNFNLINSYTVYQNIDLILSLNGVSKKERKTKVLELIKKVDLLKYKNTKVSKLSGGQKQRVAIARALAKDVPVIVADEPTGSLDKKSAESIIKLLREVAKDKLVIIVTHNYEQVEKYVTRRIIMHDGRVLDDKKIKEYEKSNAVVEHKLKNIKYFDKLTLGIKNSYNIIPKFILLFLVYSFIVCALMAEYSTFKKSEYEASKMGMNVIFKNTDDHRVVLNKNDRTAFSKEEIDNIKNMPNIKIVNINDTSLDQILAISDEKENYWMSGYVDSIENFKGKVDKGRLPKNDDEIILSGSKEDYYLVYDLENILDKDFYYRDYNTGKMSDKKYTVVGINYVENSDSLYYMEEYKFYVSNKKLQEILYVNNQRYSAITLDFMGRYISSNFYNNEFKLEANNKVPKGNAYIPETFNMYCEKENCINKTFSVNVRNIYYDDYKQFTITKLYNKNNINNVIEISNYNKNLYDEIYNGIIYINTEDYDSLFNKDTYQISVFVDDINLLDNTVKLLEEKGYHTLKIRDVLFKDEVVQILKIAKLLVTLGLIIALFSISYFIIKIILKSRNKYFSILRMLGANKNICRELLIIELFTVSNLSYFVFVLIAELNRYKLFNMDFINTVNTYFNLSDYINLYIVITVISLLISLRYASDLFKNSVMNTYREEL